MTKQLDLTNLTQKQLDQISDLVTFGEDENGYIYIKSVKGDVQGSVKGSVGGNVEGSVWGDVLGSVLGNVHGGVWGGILR